MQSAAVELEQVEFSWPGSPALLSIGHLRIERGERVFLSGPSGSGKSTLLGLIGGVLRPHQGRIRVLGTTLGELGGSGVDHFRADHIGFIFQAFNLLPYLSVDENVRLPLRFSRARRARMQDQPEEPQVRRLLQALGLGAPELLARPVHQLSIGQQQRAAAARALVGAPEILIADEPTSSLDEDAKQGFLDLLMEECRRLGTTVLMVSHDRRLAPLFDRTVDLTGLNRVPVAAP